MIPGEGFWDDAEGWDDPDNPNETVREALARRRENRRNAAALAEAVDRRQPAWTPEEAQKLGLLFGTLFREKARSGRPSRDRFADWADTLPEADRQLILRWADRTMAYHEAGLYLSGEVRWVLPMVLDYAWKDALLRMNRHLAKTVAELEERIR